MLLIAVLFSALFQGTLADTTDTLSDNGQPVSQLQTNAVENPVNYLFIHDTSVNMRKRRRISIMQSSTLNVLDNAAPGTHAALRLFGHRFPVEGPDTCEDTELIIPPGPIVTNREDFELQLNHYAEPVIGGGAPVGLALQQSLDNARALEGRKDVYLYLVDLMKCETPDPIEIIRSACEVSDLHLTIIGFGLRSDFRRLEAEGIPQLGCVDVINLMTNDEAEDLPDQLLTRLSIEFRNADGQLVDPRASKPVTFTLTRGSGKLVRTKEKSPDMPGSVIETVGLEDGEYALNVIYQGQNLRANHPLTLESRATTREVIQLGRLFIEVTDSLGTLLSNAEERQVQIVVLDDGQPIRAIEHADQATFDLLPGKHYAIEVSYVVGGKRLRTRYEESVTIHEGNHQQVRIALPIGAIAGTLVDMTDMPASQVEVTLTSADDPDREPQSVLTNDDGEYLFTDLLAGPYAVNFQKAGYAVESVDAQVLGGHVTRIEARALFHGLDISVQGVSGIAIPDAAVRIVHKATSVEYAVAAYRQHYRNAAYLPAGEYVVAVEKRGYQSASQTIVLDDADQAIDVAFALPYYVTVEGSIINGKDEPLVDAVLEFHNQRSAFLPDRTTQDNPPGVVRVTQGGQVVTLPDGSFRATLLIKEPGTERVSIVWQNLYNQTYEREFEFALPDAPQRIALQQLRLPINFLRLDLRDVAGTAISADTLLLQHQQSGQSGIELREVDAGVYESVALLDGDYVIRVIKAGYQDVEYAFSLNGGAFESVPMTLHHYVAVSGTVVDGKQNRVAGASINFSGNHSRLTSLTPVRTGKDGRFQANLLVTTADAETIDIHWNSADDTRQYRLSAEFQLPRHPRTEQNPFVLGDYELPINFITVEAQNVASRGLGGATVVFVAEDGQTFPAIERGDGVYESVDLPNGHYDILMNKTGYKENTLIADITVGPGTREERVGPIVIPHYVSVTGNMLNGKGQGVANVEVTFQGDHSEQLEQCFTDVQGRFQTTVLVTGPGDETWNATWKAPIYSTSGVFPLPGHPDKSVNIGDIHLPINFVAVPIEDVYHRALSGVNVQITQADGTPVQGEEFLLENTKPGVYEAQYVPDGSYRVLLEKDGYEIGKQVEVSVNGGMHVVIKPVTFGHYVRVEGYGLNGKKEPVAGAKITFGGHASTVMLDHDAPDSSAQSDEEPDVQSLPPAAAPAAASAVGATVVTDEAGAFSATLLVQSPQPEQIVVSWEERYSASFPLEFRQEPGLQRFDLPLPINFVQVSVRDVAAEPLSGAAVAFTHQADKAIFAAAEGEPGVYESLSGLPDGTYVMVIKKAQYEERRATFQLQGGEMKAVDYQLRHYVGIRGHAFDGKGQDLAAAIIRFTGINSQVPDKVLSGPDGIFETELLVQKIGQEAGTITWTGVHGTYTKEFTMKLPAIPTTVTLPEQTGLLPVNFISLELKSVAATGIPGASVTLTHRETGQIIEALDRDNGNYDGEELPNGMYDIAISKANYQDINLENIAVKGGEQKIDIPIPKFQHYITLSGIVQNGKQEGVSEAAVQIVTPQRVRECDPVVTREDGSFTMQALVTDAGVEPLDIAWNDIYAMTVPVELPTFPEHLTLPPVILPINFIMADIRDVHGMAIAGAAVTFLKQDRSADPLNIASLTTSHGLEASNGRYESPALPDGEYLIVLEKDGYRQQTYDSVLVRGGHIVSDVVITLPHLITLSGTIKDGRQQGIRDAEILLDAANSLHGSKRVIADATGNFREELLVTGTGPERLTVVVSGPPYTKISDEHFLVTQTVDFRTTPGEQDLPTIRMPINYIPIRVQDVSNQPIPDADVTVTWVAPVERASGFDTPAEAAGPETRSDSRASEAAVRNLGNGRYEGAYLPDGQYLLVVSKDGYEGQRRTITVGDGETAPEAVFALSHYVTVGGMVTNGKGDGVPNAVLEFDAHNSLLIENGPPEIPDDTDGTQAKSRIKTDARGQFSAMLLVKKAGAQRVRVVWQERYVKQLSFQLPEEHLEYRLENEIRLPINFVSAHVTNVLGEGLSGVNVVLEKSGFAGAETFALHSLGNGQYETAEIPDGVYTMTVDKTGYSEMSETISVQGGEQAAEQQFVLSHTVTLRGVVVNGKGSGVPGAKISLTGLSSQLLDPNLQMQTQPDGSFEVELLVTGTEQSELTEHIELSWEDQTQPFGLSYDFNFPAIPGYYNLGILTLPANFASISVQDFSGQGLSGVTVTFIDEQAKTFSAQEVMSGLYEGRNLPNGVYTIKVEKAGYKNAYQANVAIGKGHETVTAQFRLPYYVTIQGVAVDGKGQTLATDVNIKLEEALSRLVPESVTFRPDGQFSAQVLVNTPGKEYLRVSYMGNYGLHTKRAGFVLPPQPGTVDLQRITLPMNVVPVEVNDLLGYGIEMAAVMLKHLESGKEIPATEKGNGVYEGLHLPDGSYSLLISKDGYKSHESEIFFVDGGIVTETKSIQLNHYVRLTGLVTDGDGGGVRDPVIAVAGLRSRAPTITSAGDGTFDVEVEVDDVGNEQLSAAWKGSYEKSVIFKLPALPGRKNLGDIRLPVNFISILITDISGSTVPDVTVSVEDASGNVVQTLRTDQNGACKTHDVPNGAYAVSVKKPGYIQASQEVYVSDGEVLPVEIILPHYVVVRGQVKDITGKPVGGVAVIFEDFGDSEGQKLRTVTHPDTGQFEQQLLIDDARFLERRRGRFQITKGDIQQTFAFKISTQPNLTSSYTTLLFPSRYLIGKVVDADEQTTPVPDASVALVFLTGNPNLPDQLREAVYASGTSEEQQALHFSSDALGAFEAGSLQEGEYRVTIRKDGYEEYEDYIHIPGLLQEKIFTLRKVTR